MAESPVIIDFLRYMQRIHPADRLPARRDFDPLHIPALLGHIVLAEVHRRPLPDPPRFFMRVVGDVVQNAAPVSMANRYLDELDGKLVAPDSGMRSTILTDVRRQVLETGQLYYWRGPPRMKFRYDYDDLEYVHCPLADDGRRIDRILSAFYYRGGEQV